MGVVYAPIPQKENKGVHHVHLLLSSMTCQTNKHTQSEKTHSNVDDGAQVYIVMFGKFGNVANR